VAIHVITAKHKLLLEAVPVVEHILQSISSENTTTVTETSFSLPEKNVAVEFVFTREMSYGWMKRRGYRCPLQNKTSNATEFSPPF
jgi:hypothetical protein